MAEPVLGLDIGSDSVKGVLALRKGRADLRVIAAEIVPLAEGVDLEAALKKMAEVFRIFQLAVHGNAVHGSRG